MNRAAAMMTSALAVLCGCISSHDVGRDQAETWLRDAQHDLIGEEVVLTTRSGVTHEGEVVRFSEQAVVLRAPDTATSVLLTLDSVATVATRSSPFPAIGGLLVGGLLGGVIGLYSAEWEDALFGKVPGQEAEEAALVGALIGGAVAGGGMAILTGADRYTVTHPAVPRAGNARMDTLAAPR